MKKQTTNKELYLKRSYTDFCDSLKDSKSKLMVVMLYDFLFYLFSGIVLLYAKKALDNKQAELLALEPSRIAQNFASIAQTSSFLEHSFYTLLAIPIIAVLLLIVTWSLFKGLSWAFAKSQKFTRSYFNKFLIMSFIWFVSWTIIFISIGFSIKEEAIPSVITMLYVLLFHFSWILVLVFTGKESIFKSIKKAFYLGIVEFRLFIIPYIVMFLLFILISMIAGILPESIRFIAMSLLLLGELSFCKIYIVRVFKDFITS